jgi:acyl carrier protein
MLYCTTPEPEARIFEIVHRLLRDRAIERSFTANDNLRDIGLTSLDLTNLVLSVEGELSVRIPDNAITPANFTCIAAIAGMVAKLLNAETNIPSATSIEPVVERRVILSHERPSKNDIG